MRIRYRRPSILDAPSIAEIKRSSFPMLDSSLTKVISQIALYGSTSLVGLSGLKLVVYAFGDLYQGDVYHLREIAVHPEFRRRGVGSTTLRVLERFVKRKGVDKIILEVAVSNEAAIRMYEKGGFRIVKRLEKYYPWGEDAYLMVKEL